MTTHDDLPSPPASDDGSDDESYEGSDTSDGPREPRLTPQELGALFIDFYTFLTTLHYDKADLKIPPSEGWSEITAESCGRLKSGYAIEVMRHLPYFDEGKKASIHYKSKILDLRAWTPGDFKRLACIYEYEGHEFWSSEKQIDPSEVVCIADGYEYGHRLLWLYVTDCEIVEEMSECGEAGPISVESYFAKLKEEHETLKLIPGRGRVTIEADKVPECKERISEDEVKAQTEEWGTNLDIQYVRQVYRDHGWPHSFDKEAAFSVIDDLLRPMEPDDNGDREIERGLGWQRTDDNW